MCCKQTMKTEIRLPQLYPTWRRYLHLMVDEIRMIRENLPGMIREKLPALVVGLAMLYLSWNSNANNGLEEKEMVVGVISARDHFDQRLAIRLTWRKFFPDSEHKFMFIIGDKECDIHPDNRVSPYACEMKAFPHKEKKNFFMTDISQENVKTASSQGIISIAVGLKVHFPVKIESLGILTSLSDFGIVYVKDPSGEVHMTFEPDSYRCLHHREHREAAYCYLEQLMYKPTPIILPKGFEGEIVFHLDGNTKEFYEKLRNNKLLHTSQCSWSRSNRFEYTFIQTPWGSTLEWTPHSCSIISAEIVAADEEVESLEVIAKRQENWKRKMASNEEKIQTEMKEFGTWNDILVLPIEDTYKSLPHKVLEFIKWSIANYKFKYLLKLDDDSFIDKRNLSKLLDKGPHDDIAWWSFFKKERAVQRFGKWADLKYPSPMYIDFPAGSGYLMTYEMASRLVAASKYLQYYQGEDVSIGLWAAAVVGPTQYHVRCWLPSPHCPDGSVIQEQKEPYELFKMWKDNSEEFLKSDSV